MCLKNFITENIEKLAFPLTHIYTFILKNFIRLILANRKELYKNYLRLKTPVLIKILRLTEIYRHFYIKNQSVIRATCLAARGHS